VRLPDKSSGVPCSGASVRDKYEFIDAEYAAADTATTAPTISQMCEWLGVSKSGFYEWRSNPGPATAKRREELKLFIRKAFDDADGTYGYRRVHAQLLRWGVRCGDELVRALMRELGLVPCQVRRRRSLTVQAAAGPIPDLVGRDFTAESPVRRWSATSPAYSPGRDGSTCRFCGI
jgi:putative transposase